MKPRRVLVTDARRASALAVIRSLGRAGHHVVVADTDATSVGAASRYARASASYPSPYADGVAATAEAVAELARTHAVDAVVPVTDDVLVPLTGSGVELPSGCTLVAAPAPALATAGSKVATVALARRLGLPVPDDRVLVGPDGAAGVVAALGSPVVVKPDRSRVVGPDGRLRRGEVSYARTDEEVATAVASAGQPVLAQALHPGVGVGVGLVLDQGRPLMAVQHRRVHEVPVSGGASARRETVDLDPDLLDHACRLLGAMAWTGAAMVELKVGPSGPALMEVNGRLWGSLPLAVRAGMDIPSRLLEVHLEGAPPQHPPIDARYRRGVQARNLELELVWIGSVLTRGRRCSSLVEIRRRDGLSAAADLLRPGQGDDLHARDDLRPLLTGVRRSLGHAARKAVDRA